MRFNVTDIFKAGRAAIAVLGLVFALTGCRQDMSQQPAYRPLTESQFFNDGRAAALATVLFIAVLPVMILNLRNFRRQAAM